MTDPSVPSWLKDFRAVEQWVAIVSNARTPQQQACLSTAQAIADAAHEATTVNRRETPFTADPRDAAWCHIALTAYHRLLDADAHHGLNPAPRCAADATRLREWLDGPCGMPGFETDTAAKYWDFDLFHYESADDVEKLVEQAQRAGVFGVPGHTVLAWYINGDNPDLDGFLVTVDTPTGHALCSDWLPYDTVMPRERTGIDAAVHVLTELSTSVDDALAGRPSRRGDRNTAAGNRPGVARAFPPPGDIARQPAPSTSATTPGPAPPHRSTGPHR